MTVALRAILQGRFVERLEDSELGCGEVIGDVRKVLNSARVTLPDTVGAVVCLGADRGIFRSTLDIFL